MKRQIFVMALLASASVAWAKTEVTEIVFNELPYSEGTLYIAIEDSCKNILMKAIEVEADSASTEADLSPYIGKEIAIKAFQDLNGNQRLDMDAYGRPTEPCLQTTFTPASDSKTYTFQLIQY